MSDAIDSMNREVKDRYRGGFSSHPIRSEAPTWREALKVAGTLALGFLLLAAVLSTAGCVSAAAIKQAETNAAINRGHERDTKLPPEARAIGQDNADAWEVQLFNLTGKDPSPETLKRIEARQKAAGAK